MNLQLEGKIALVTGSTSGIGLAIALTLASEGAEVIISGRSQARVDEAIAKIRTQVPNAALRGFAGDLARASVTDELIRAFPTIDILVNNLGIYEMKAFVDASDADWQHHIETNFMSGMRLARFYLTQLLQRNWGRILFIASESAFDVPPELIHYAVTKTMQVALSRGLARLCQGSQVTVNALVPGPTSSDAIVETLSDLARKRGVSREVVEQEVLAQMRPNSLLRRFATPKEIASLCVYLASPLAAATNGAALRRDGGIINSLQ